MDDTIPSMIADPRAEAAAHRTALLGALAGLALAGALLAPALAGGGVPARGDLADFFWPMKAYTAERWLEEGRPPLWNPLSGAGEPWLAQLQSGVLYPLDAPFLLGWREGALLGIALHLAVAAAGAAFLLWELGATRAAALTAAGIYAGGGAYLSLVPVYNNASTAAWLPWLLAGARRTALGRSRGAGFAVAVAASFLAGEPALAAAGTGAAVLLALWAGPEGEPPAASAGSRRHALRLALPLAAGLGLAAAGLLPFAELVESSARRESVTREEAVARAVGSSELADVVAAPRPETTRHAAPSRGGYLVALGLGPLPLILAAGAGAGLPGRRRLLGGLALVGTGGLVLALGASGLLAPLLHDVGLLRGVRFPARWVVFAHLALAVAAGAGLDGWLWGRFRRPKDAADLEGDEAREALARRRAAFLGLGVGALLLAPPALLVLTDPAIRAERDPARTAVGLVAAFLGAAALALGRRAGGARAPALSPLVAAAAVVPLPFLAGEALASVPSAAVRLEPPGVADLPRGADAGRLFAPAGQDRSLSLRWRYAGGADWGPEEVRRAAGALAGYTNLFHGLATAGSASPLGNPRTGRLLGSALAGGDVARILALLDVRHVVSPFPARAPGLRLEAERGGIRMYRVAEPFGRAYFPAESREASDDEAFAALRSPRFDPGRVALVARSAGAPPLPPGHLSRGWAAARFLSDRPERAEIATSASAPSLLVLTRSWDAGWSARVDGERVPLLRAQLGLLAVVVPEGEHRLELLYRPASWRVGLALSAAGLLAVLGLALAGPPGGRR